MTTDIRYALGQLERAISHIAATGSGRICPATDALLRARDALERVLEHAKAIEAVQAISDDQLEAMFSDNPMVAECQAAAEQA